MFRHCLLYTSNLYAVLADGDFTMDFPHVTYDTVTERYSFRAKFHTKPNFKITIGGNVSSTAFNQAYIGVNYQTIGRVGQQLGADLYLGPIYTCLLYTSGLWPICW